MKRHQIWKYIKETPTWVLLVLFLAVVAFSIHNLRRNNLEMINKRTALYAADKKAVGVDQALNDLRSYVYGHMNTNLANGGNTIKPPIQLKYTYDRLVKAQQKTTAAQTASLEQKARRYCEVHQPGKYRQVCFEKYFNQLEVKTQTISPALYQFDFISPTWSPDLAGWTLILAVLLGIIFLVSFIADRIINLRIKYQRSRT